MIFISAFIPEVGESLIGAFGGVPPDWYDRDVSHPFICLFPAKIFISLRLQEANGIVSAVDPYNLFFHDVPDGERWARTLRPHAWVTKNSPAISAPTPASPELLFSARTIVPSPSSSSI